MNKLQAIAVIGANYGDEGKGATTHREAWSIMDRRGANLHNRNSPLVVRFNGGGQAGHTVQLEDGRRHIFSQIGSGAFLDCPTYLSEHFLFNPVAFVKEMQTWMGHSGKFPNAAPTIYIHPHAKVVTPADVFANQLAETQRKNQAHGSCGHGIGATMGRNKVGFSLSYEDLFDIGRLIPKIVAVRASYQNALSPGLDQEPWARFYAAIKCLPNWIQIADYHQLPKKDVIFEGAQGLLLDQDNEDHFPHVTYSKTGSDNILDIMDKMEEAGWDIGLDKLVYCTRPYLTRHGNGPMLAAVGGKECKLEELELINFEDKTNVPNKWQGALRFGKMDWPQFMARIQADAKKVIKHYQKPMIMQLSVICADQAPHLLGGVTKQVSCTRFINGLKLKTKFIENGKDS